MEQHHDSPQPPVPITGDGLVDTAGTSLTAYSRACPEQGRRDGWTPFARRLFLEVLAETGRVTTACEFAQLTKQSAYALRARDPLFAAGWDAACELARAPLADALYERAVDGVTETITRNGEVVAERHRHDSRLSIAVLNRLDKRCDRAAELGSGHLALVRRWDEWLALVGRGDDKAAEALLQTAPHGQLGQLPQSGNPIPDDLEEEEEQAEHCWIGDDGTWLTDFPPPAGFDGYQKHEWGQWGYERECTAEEAALLDAAEDAAELEKHAEEERRRDAWFGSLRAGVQSIEQAAPDEPRES